MKRTVLLPGGADTEYHQFTVRGYILDTGTIFMDRRYFPTIPVIQEEFFQ